jgi:hydrogenase maturation protease
MKTLIVGLGNPILGDDGVGWRVADEIARATAGVSGIEVDCASLGGLSLMERLTGSERVVLIDSIYTGTKPVGTVSRFALSDIPDLTSGHSGSAHDTSLRTALQVGRSMDVPLPADEAIAVVAVEAKTVYDFSQELSPAVEAAVAEAVRTVLDVLKD